MKLIIPLAAAIALVSPAFAESTLKIGDPAPSIQSAKWLKGTAEEKFDPSLVHVVEFWATWCGPCKKNIPHLTELAVKYQGKARIIGMNIWEAEKDPAKRLAVVTKFVEAMGDKMNYAVATDDAEGSIAKTWMEAAGEKGIPVAFVIGKNGKIAWFGHPANLDNILDQAVNGTLDTAAVQRDMAQRSQQKDEKERVRTLLKPVSDLLDQKKPAEAIAALDKVIAEHPEFAANTGFLRYNCLRTFDQPAAWQLARKLMEGEGKDNASMLYRIGRDLTDPPGPKTPDWDLAIAVSQRACDLKQNKDASSLSILAAAHAGKGDFAKAVEVGDLAVKLAKADPEFPKGSAEYIENSVNGYRQQLEKQSH